MVYNKKQNKQTVSPHIMAAKTRSSSRAKTPPAPPKRFAQAATFPGEEARFVIDADGVVLYATSAFATLVNVTPDKMTGQKLPDLLAFDNPDEALRAQNLFGTAPAAYIDAVNEGLHKVALFGHASPARTRFQFDRVEAGDGRRYMIGTEVAGRRRNKHTRPDPAVMQSLLKLAAGRPVAPAQTDESAINQATDEGELRHFLNMSNDLMAIAHKDGTFARVNDSFTAILGYDITALRRMSFLDLVHPEDRPQVRSSLFGLMRDESGEGMIIDFETRMIAADEQVRWMEWRQKRSGHSIYAVGHDVTAAKAHESALRKQERMLGEAQAIGNMGHWHWVVGAEDIVWSDEIYRIFGVDKDEFVPTLDNVNAMLHRRDVGRLMQAFQRAIIEQNNYEMEFRLIRPDDSIRYVRCEGKCELDEDGEVIGLFGIMQDITERTHHERQLKEAKDLAERAYAAKTQFLANMSHELRTPLNAIIGFSEMMQRQLLGPIGTEKYLDYIAGIRESGEHLLDLISDILDMSKIEAGKYEPDLEELNAAKVIRLAVHMMEGRAQDARIKITIDLANEDLQIVADRRALMQILLNLLSNAVKFTEPGGDVRIECLERDNYVSIKIHDTGIGIPANKMACITNPFEQAANHYTREHEGTGLGLAITKDLVELHRGTMHIDSTVGVGTSVTIRLPYNAHDEMKKRRKQS